MCPKLYIINAQSRTTPQNRRSCGSFQKNNMALSFCPVKKIYLTILRTEGLFIYMYSYCGMTNLCSGLTSYPLRFTSVLLLHVCCVVRRDFQVDRKQHVNHSYSIQSYRFYISQEKPKFILIIFGIFFIYIRTKMFCKSSKNYVLLID